MPLSDISFFHLGSRLDVGQPGGSVSEPSLAFKAETRRLAPHMVRPPRVPSVGTGTQAPRNGPGPSPSSSGSTPPRGRRNGTGSAGTGHGRTAGRGVATSPSGPSGDGPQCLVEERMETSLGRRKLASMSGSGGRRLRSVLGSIRGIARFFRIHWQGGGPKAAPESQLRFRGGRFRSGSRPRGKLAYPALEVIRIPQPGSFRSVHGNLSTRLAPLHARFRDPNLPTPRSCLPAR